MRPNDRRLHQVRFTCDAECDIGWRSDSDVATFGDLVCRHEAFEEGIGLVGVRSLRVSIPDPCEADELAYVAAASPTVPTVHFSAVRSL